MNFQWRVMVLAASMASAAMAGPHWPDFRGPSADGHSDEIGLPLKWSETKNVKWKTQVPGKGWSSPIVHGDQIWMTTATDGGRKLHAICFDRESGKLLHDTVVFTPAKAEEVHKLNSHASPSPVTRRRAPSSTPVS